MATATTATLALPSLDTAGDDPRLRCALWWDTEPRADALFLEASTDGIASWQPVPFTTVRAGEDPRHHPVGAVTGWSGRVWHRLTARLPRAARTVVRWRYVTDRLYVGRGAYIDGLRVEMGGGVLCDEKRPADAGRIDAVGWTASAA
jgi:hypothetical protein